MHPGFDPETLGVHPVADHRRDSECASIAFNADRIISGFGFPDGNTRDAGCPADQRGDRPVAGSGVASAPVGSGLVAMSGTSDIN